ncbi:disease resistance protein RUN1-like [Vicia villosa]|uniref:disease resistance protein RUN1-like n=1 Tax=Vicia villosa TaxID=3911 RepID=UPI00273CCE80|nr:disease resistance protein RUN1-like [Vicia villosa]
MAVKQYIGSSSSSMVASLKKFDVFISFHGKDTRKTITSHLYEALRKKVQTFIDFELEKGDEISSALNKAIEESDASVVIFSKHYASSKWCLNELVKILECKRDRRQIVIPVFYDIEPSHVRNQTGSYKQAFEKHERDLRHNKEKLQKWKNALTEAANLSGWNSQNYGNDADFVNDVVEDVLEKLYRKYPFEVNKELVGIEKKCEKMESLLEIGSNDVRTLVLWGMGGIGKTTLAKHLFAKQYAQFERTCIIENIREESTKHGPTFVRSKLISTLLKLPLNAPYVETPNFINRLAHGRSLIVLDDVETFEQAENVNIVNNCLGEGSRVIITTRNKQICNLLDKYEIYEFEKMNADESLQLFCLKAFGEKFPKEGYDNLSEEAILYCSGNPLALKVLGANFGAKKSKEAWESELEKLKKNPNRNIHDVLKLSFDGLDRPQQDIFLDIACISGLQACYESLDSKDYFKAVWNACKFFADSGLEVLLDKALIYVYDERYINMHDLLKEMGKEIVMTESVKDPGRRSRLWDQNDVYDVLKYNKGTEVVEVIEFNIDRLGDLYLSSDCFKSMTSLRHLEITIGYNSRLHLLEGLEWLSEKLRYIRWQSFPLESLPSTFGGKWLVHLTMQHSKLKKLWDGIQRLDNLMILDLDHSKDLIEIPDLSRAPNLQVVSLCYCVSLCQLHPSIFSAPKLKELCLHGCKKIQSLKNHIYSTSLQILNLSDSSYLAEFSVTSEEMMELSLWGSVVHGFSSLMLCNKKFTELHLTGCTQINTSSLWLILDGTPSLKELYLSKCCYLEFLPDNIQNNSMLEILYLNDCRTLKSLPKLPVSMRSFRAQNCIHLDTLSIQQSIHENMLHRLRSHEKMLHNRYCSRSYWNVTNCPMDLCFSPGGEVPSEFYFHTTKDSIVIPPIPKYGLYGFVFCIILSEEVANQLWEVLCIIYQHTQEIDRYSKCFWEGTLISDHVLIGCIGCYNSDWVKAGMESEGHHYNLSFQFIYRGSEGMRTGWVKSCGIIPVYDLKHSFALDGRISGVEIVEIQSNAQLSDHSDDCHGHLKFDINESQPQKIGAENEDGQQQLIIPPTENMELNDKSSCACSIGILLKYILEESKRLFLKQR